MTESYFWLGLEAFHEQDKEIILSIPPLLDGNPVKYWRCKCGKAQMWESGFGNAPCRGCTECKTTLSQHPDDHKPLTPHDWKPRFDTHTGQPDGMECDKCYKRDFNMTHPDRKGYGDCTRVQKRKMKL